MGTSVPPIVIYLESFYTYWFHVFLTEVLSYGSVAHIMLFPGFRGNLHCFGEYATNALLQQFAYCVTEFVCMLPLAAEG
jgi:hypothetical protein